MIYMIFYIGEIGIINYKRVVVQFIRITSVSISSETFLFEDIKGPFSDSINTQSGTNQPPIMSVTMSLGGRFKFTNLVYDFFFFFYYTYNFNTLSSLQTLKRKQNGFIQYFKATFINFVQLPKILILNIVVIDFFFVMCMYHSAFQ